MPRKGPTPDIARIAEALEPWRRAHRRAAWRPVTEDRPGAPTESRFGGLPYLGADESWSRCNSCQHPMQFFLQLDLGTLPDASPLRADSGLLQMFYCTFPYGHLPPRQIVKQRPKPRCEAECRNGMPFSPGVLLRVVRPVKPAELLAPPSGGAESFPPRVIVGWERFEDFPDGCEHEALGLKYHYRFEPGYTYTRVEWPGGSLRFDEVGQDNSGPGLSEAISEAAPRDKLGGWPHWIQAPEYVQCPRCRTRMTYLFQLDSRDHLPYLFGDMGCGHIFRCASHPDLLAFTWECS